MDFNNIEDVVRQYVIFKGSSSNGWNHCYCEYCGDGKREKGPRGNWLFSDDMAFYNCWNCGAKASFDPHREIPFSKDMHGIFKSFGIPLRECYALIPKEKNNELREVKPYWQKQSQEPPMNNLINYKSLLPEGKVQYYFP